MLVVPPGPTSGEGQQGKPPGGSSAPLPPLQKVLYRSEALAAPSFLHQLLGAVLHPQLLCIPRVKRGREGGREGKKPV